MKLQILATVFRQIADDAAHADPKQFKKLTTLVIALEQAYPTEMASLRDEEIDMITCLMEEGIDE